MKERLTGIFTGERSLFMAQDKHITGSVFEDGESPLKHSKNIEVEDSQFKWKYPFWYSENISVKNCTFYEMGRAGIWYTRNISVSDCAYIAPKGFRRCDGVSITNVNFPNAAETLWQCRNVKLNNVTAKGDYLAMNCENMEIDGLNLDGNYSFDGAKNVTIRNSRLMSKDAFWNSEDITAENCYINGEYLGWNSKNLTLIHCTIESLQGLCFCENLTLIGCKLVNTTLAFEYSTVNAEIIGMVDSIKNPLGGVIKCEGIGELIMEEDKVEIGKTEFISNSVTAEA
ncbi:MAG: DUF3737 family protein [Oscillospiraceae bacterium]|nr:DUF3737 family protein [Oscillospiraceae bacterium]